MRAYTWLIPLLLVSGAAAQGLVSPANFENAEAFGYGWGSLGSTTQPSAYLAIHEDMQGRPATIRGVSFRRDGFESGDRRTYASEFWLVSVYVSTAATTAASPDAIFANNHGPDKVRVVGPSYLVSFAETHYTGLVEPFDYQIPFLQPFAWDGNGALCIEIQVEQRSPGLEQWYLDFTSYSSSTNPPVRSVKTGSGCIATAHSVPMDLAPSQLYDWPSGRVTLTYTGSYMPPTTTSPSLVAFLIGAQQSLGGVPLPLEIPLTAIGPGGTSSSGPCYLHNDVLVTVPSIADPTGSVTRSIGLPVTPAFNGLGIYATAVGIDPDANYLGAVTSNGTHHHLAAPWANTGVGCVFKDGPPLGTGSVLANQGYVLRFDT